MGGIVCLLGYESDDLCRHAVEEAKRKRVYRGLQPEGFPRSTHSILAEPHINKQKDSGRTEIENLSKEKEKRRVY